MIIVRFKIHNDMKLMTKRSTYFRRFTESCRWWDCSGRRNMEWTWEGGSKKSDVMVEMIPKDLSNAQRDFRPLSRESA